MHYHDAGTSLLEAVLSRAGRDMAPVIVDAWRAGARFDAWTEQFSLERWERAAETTASTCAISPGLLDLDMRLPWQLCEPGCIPGLS